MRLTQCMIVKNEEKNLTRALSWGKGLFDEQIVVDTGSVDGTVELAKRLGAKALDYTWTDDFAAAKNFAIEACSGDWIFFLDADEYFQEEDVPCLRPLIAKIDRYTKTVKGREYRYNAVDMPWVNIGAHNGRQTRIFRNTPYLRYAGAVHERLQAQPQGYLKVYTVEEKPAIYHTGYLWSAENTRAAKCARNFEIAKKAMEKTPDCAKFRLFAAEALTYGERYEEAEAYFAQAMENRDGSIWPERTREGFKQWMGIYTHMEGWEPRERLVPALAAYTAATAQFPDDPDFDILMSLLFFKTDDIANTLRFFNASLAKNGGRISEGIIGNEAYNNLREVCLSLQKDGLL